MTDLAAATNHEETAAMFRRLREFKRATKRLRGGSHQLTVAMIGACIVEGMNTRRRLVAALQTLGFRAAQVVPVLGEGAGPDPSRHHWMLLEDGTFALHELTAEGDPTAPPPGAGA